MENIVILDGVTLAVFVVLVVAVCLIGAISSLGWLIESEQRKKAQLRADRLAAEHGRLLKKELQNTYMDELTVRYLKEKGGKTIPAHLVGSSDNGRH